MTDEPKAGSEIDWEAAKTLTKYNNGVGRRCSDPHIRDLEAILAKGDSK